MQQGHDNEITAAIHQSKHGLHSTKDGIRWLCDNKIHHEHAFQSRAGIQSSS